MEGKGKDAALGPMFGAIWAGRRFEIPYNKIDWPPSHQSSEWEPDRVIQEPTLSREPKEPECARPDPSPSGVAPGPSCVERGLPRRIAAPKLGLDETMELLLRVVGAGDEDPDLSALSAALKAKLGLSALKKAPNNHVLWCGTSHQGSEKLQRHPQLSYGHLS